MIQASSPRAGAVGFEPTGGPIPRTVLKTAALSHSATPPKGAHQGPYLLRFPAGSDTGLLVVAPVVGG